MQSVPEWARAGSANERRPKEISFFGGKFETEIEGGWLERCICHDSWRAWKIGPVEKTEFGIEVIPKQRPVGPVK
jgi:hypothetical protein